MYQKFVSNVQECPQAEFSQPWQSEKTNTIKRNPTGFVSFVAQKYMFLNTVEQQCFRKAFLEKTVRCHWGCWES